jgi:bifunctional DNA-binding transcriptional regulator/antitoxin component of YhaV-PrlF toxin-antitoxin module
VSEIVSVDEKGRLVLPRKVREAAGISVGTELLAKASGLGRVELSDPEVLKARAREIGAKKLEGWDEESHEATGYLVRSVKKPNEAH